jgi:hypothetical protein
MLWLTIVVPLGPKALSKLMIVHCSTLTKLSFKASHRLDFMLTLKCINNHLSTTEMLFLQALWSDHPMQIPQMHG